MWPWYERHNQNATTSLVFKSGTVWQVLGDQKKIVTSLSPSLTGRERCKRMADSDMSLTIPDVLYNEGYQPGAEELWVDWARGGRIRDVRGNSYVDLNLGAGTALLGHAHPVVTAAISEQAARGTLYIRPNPIAREFAELLVKAVPSLGGVVFCNSGAEATMRACRIARAFTGKSKIAMFSGGWHGAHDQLLIEEDYGGNAVAPRACHRSAGIPRELLDLVVFLPYNDDHAFELITRHRNELAMVLIEPSQGSNPRADVGPFLKRLRQTTKAANVLLGFDEVITGFRVALGGAQEFYDIEADIVTYGKIVGGGLSIGVIAGRKDIMEAVRQVPDGTGRSVLMGGTFSANPLAMAAGRATLRLLLDGRGRIYAALNDAGTRIVQGVNRLCGQSGIPVHATGIGSMFRLIFTDRPIRSRRERDALELGYDIQNRFYTAVLNRGVHVGSNRINFLSSAHGPEEIEATLEAFAATLIEGQRAGWLRHAD